MTEERITVAEAIRRAVPVFTAYPGEDVYVIRDELVKAGVPPRLAADVVEFLPLAVARAVMDGMGIHFAEEYVRRSPQGRVIEQKRLTDEPVYREALAAAAEISGMGDTVFQALVERSPEYRAVRTALDGGARADDLSCGMPIMIENPDDLRLFGREQRTGEKSWWQFWK